MSVTSAHADAEQYLHLWLSLAEQVRRLALDGPSNDTIDHVSQVVNDANTHQAHHARQVDQHLRFLHQQLRGDTTGQWGAELEEPRSYHPSTSTSSSSPSLHVDKLATTLQELQEAQMRVSQYQDAAKEHGQTVDEIRRILKEAEGGMASIDAELVQRLQQCVSTYQQQCATFAQLQQTEEAHTASSHELESLRTERDTLQRTLDASRQRVQQVSRTELPPRSQDLTSSPPPPPKQEQEQEPVHAGVPSVKIAMQPLPSPPSPPLPPARPSLFYQGHATPAQSPPLTGPHQTSSPPEPRAYAALAAAAASATGSRQSTEFFRHALNQSQRDPQNLARSFAARLAIKK